MSTKTWLGIVFLVGTTNVFAHPVQTTANAPFLAVREGKITQVGVIPQGSTLDVRTQRKSYLLVKWRGKVGWVSERAVRGRTPAMQRGPGSTHDDLAFGASLGLQSGALSFGLGPHVFYHLPVSWADRWDAGLAVFYLPGVSNAFSSVSALEVLALGRWMRAFQKGMEVGAEAGLMMLSINASVTTTIPGIPSDLNVGSTGFGVVFGGAYSYEIADSLRLLAGLRILISSGSGFLFSGGVEYRI